MTDNIEEDGTASFADGPVDGLVYVQNSDSPELRRRDDVTAMEPRLTINEPAPQQRQTQPVEPWTPGAPPADTARSSEVAKQGTQALRTPLKIVGGLILVAIPILVTLWIVRTGMSLYGG